MEILSAILLVLALVFVAFATFNLVKILIAVILDIKTKIKRKHLNIELDSYSNRAKIIETFSKKLGHHNKINKYLLRFKHSKQGALIRKEMPDAIRLICIALDSGSSLVKSLNYASVNVKQPLAKELSGAVWDMQAGYTFDAAMERLRQKYTITEFSFLSIAMEIQHECGGSLSEILKSTSQLLKQYMTMQNLLETKTAQAKLSSKIIAIMPFILLAVLSFLQPGYLAYFFTNILGIFLFILAIVLELLGILLVRKTLNLNIDLKIG
ncbi:MAG: type II secretion system F family protein [Coriobacteriales bacterium]|nr:type II secretion system F family protein [Coriobacteriales bacterium]